MMTETPVGATIEKIDKKLEARLAEILQPDEHVVFKIDGGLAQALVATDQRAIILKRGAVVSIVGGISVYTQPYGAIAGIEWTWSPLTWGYFAIQTAGATPISSRSIGLGNKQLGEATKAANAIGIRSKKVATALETAAGWIQSKATAAHAAPAPSPASASDADEINKLGELHQAGLLTSEEFAAAKAKLLGI